MKRRAAIAKQTMSSLRNIWLTHNINTETKNRLVKTIVFSLFCYGVKCWTLKGKFEKEIGTSKCTVGGGDWVYWTENRINESISRQLQITKILRAIVVERITGYFGHTVGRGGIENLTIQEKFDTITKTTRMPLAQTLDPTRDRDG